jgi:succinoglycan biosynthesis transport protein ExoP
VDLRELLSVVWKRRLVVILVVVLTVGCGVAYGQTRQPTYESTVTVAITPNVAKVGFIPSDNLSALLGTYAQTAESDVVRTAAQRILGRPLSGTVSGSSQAGTGILRISARAPSPSGAKQTAQAVAKAFLDRIQNDTLINAEVVDPAATPSQPVQPRMPLIIGASLIVGLGVAILFALGLERFRARVETIADVGEIAPLPLLGQLPKSRDLSRSGPRIVWDEPGWVDIQESLRSLRTNLQLITADSGKAIQITSPSAGQGKSTIVANLAVAFAQVGVRTAIVDADLRRPAQHVIFKIDNRRNVWGDHSPQPGWMGALARKTSYPELGVFPAGHALNDPTELLHVRFPRLIEELREAYDLILVDSPPLLPVSDALITAAWMDSVVLIMSAGQERPSSVRHAIDGLDLTGAKLAGVVINQASGAGVGGHDYYRRAGFSMPAPESATPPIEPAPTPARERPRAGAR